MSIKNFIPPRRGLGSENKFSESFEESTDEGLSREHWRCLMIFKPIYVLKSLIEYICLKYLVHTGNNP